VEKRLSACLNWRLATAAVLLRALGCDNTEAWLF